LVFSKFADTLEAHASFSKKTAQKNYRGLLRTPGMTLRTHLYTHKGVADEFKNQ
jgi:hypothetical protein